MRLDIHLTKWYLKPIKCGDWIKEGYYAELGVDRYSFLCFTLYKYK